MEKAPEFFERVLKRRSRDEEALIRIKVHQRFVQQRVVILQPVRLINRQTRPFKALLFQVFGGK